MNRLTALVTGVLLALAFAPGAAAARAHRRCGGRCGGRGLPRAPAVSSLLAASRLRAVLPLAAALVAAVPAAAQEASAAPFSRVEVSAAGAAVRGDQRMRQWWRPGPGALLRVSTPFYLGSVALTAEVSRFRAHRPEEQPDFRALTRVAEWNAERPLGRGVRVFGGAQVGSLDMSFVDPPTDSGNLDENEFLMGVQAGVSGSLWRGVGATLLASRRRVLTHHPLRLTTVSAGLSYGFDTPAWLREVLQ